MKTTPCSDKNFTYIEISVVITLLLKINLKSHGAGYRWYCYAFSFRYLIDDDRAIFMFKDGSQAWTAKEFLIEQDELKDVQLESQTYPGKKPDVRNTAVHDEL